jgi:hypothetical protein
MPVAAFLEIRFEKQLKLHRIIRSDQLLLAFGGVVALRLFELESPRAVERDEVLLVGGNDSSERCAGAAANDGAEDSDSLDLVRLSDGGGAT